MRAASSNLLFGFYMVHVENEGMKARRGRESSEETKMRGKMKGSSDEVLDQLNNRLQTLNLWGPMKEGTKTRRGGESRMEMKMKGKMKGSRDEMVDVLNNRLQTLPREATDEELLLVHTKSYVDIMKSTQTMSVEELATLSLENGYGDLYPLVDRVMKSKLKNGFAVIRPPGSLVQGHEVHGACLFNSVAIAARYAQVQHSASRVLIVDLDDHYVFGTKRLFQDDPSVLFVSTESDTMFSDCARTMNVTWNKKGKNDADCYSAFIQLLEPVAQEFQPDLVLVFSGFNAVLENPRALGTLTRSLMGIAEGRVIFAIEGAYNLQETAWVVAACVETLIERPPDFPPFYVQTKSTLESITETISTQFPYW
ncbi:histone deacetylase 6-like [Limanda limanda]|uniref:histone deacetylase 6-like n=1 Tax=Limanda limanda TaxID=27771 RepID=UPI0029C7EFF7|nr:histone deacetylase 6-like [Limanda limanda]